MPLSNASARNTRTRRALAAALALFAAAASIAIADPIAVRHTQGAVHGFLVIRSQAGATLGYGEFIQDADGDRVTAHLTYHFRDGSLDDETFVYTQHDIFHFVSDHHIQRGPFFPKPSELTVAADGTVTTITPSKDGQPKTETQHIDLPADVSNGMIGTLLANFDPHAPAFRLGQVIPFQGKARLIHLDITPGAESSFTVAGTHRKATVYHMKIDIGGVAGLIAPIVGKQPPDIEAWVLEGDAPLFVREIGQLAEDAPIVSIEFAGATFPHASAASKKKGP
jgi:hypothetical protein